MDKFLKNKGFEYRKEHVPKGSRFFSLKTFKIIFQKMIVMKKQEHKLLVMTIEYNKKNSFVFKVPQKSKIINF